MGCIVISAKVRSQRLGLGVVVPAVTRPTTVAAFDLCAPRRVYRFRRCCQLAPRLSRSRRPLLLPHSLFRARRSPSVATIALPLVSFSSSSGPRPTRTYRARLYAPCSMRLLFTAAPRHRSFFLPLFFIYLHTRERVVPRVLPSPTSATRTRKEKRLSIHLASPTNRSRDTVQLHSHLHSSSLLFERSVISAERIDAAFYKVRK